MPVTLPPSSSRKRPRLAVFPVAPRPPIPSPAPFRPVPAKTIGLVPILTFVLWAGCLAIGGLGYALPYARPRPPAPEPAPVTFEKLAVELAADPLPVIAEAAALTAPLALPTAAPPLAVAAPSPALAFPLPVAGPVRIVDVAQASSSARTVAPTVRGSAPVQPLVFGRGEGRQPAPVYPAAAIRQGQEGTVTIRFNVGPDGRVLSAIVALASPWPLLDEAALRTVRERWRFAPGPARAYEVPIRFTLRK